MRCNWCIRLMATTNAVSGTSNWCQIMNGSSLPHWRVRAKTYAEMFELREWWLLELGLGSHDMETETLLDVFLSHSVLLLIFGSQPSTNGSSTGFYHQSLEVEFPCTSNRQKGCHWAVLISSKTYDFVQVHTRQQCVMLPSIPFPFLLYGLCSPGGLHLMRAIM